MFGWFKRRFDTPVEQRDYGKLYAGLSLLLFVGTLGVVYNEIDTRRPWKDYQEQFKALKVRVLKHQLKQAKAAASEKEYDALRSEIAKIDRQLQGPDLRAVQARIEELAEDIRDLSQERANLKAVADNRNYLFEHGRKQGHEEEAEEYRKERGELEGEMAEFDSRIDSLEKVKSGLAAEKVTPLVDRRKSLESKRDSLFGKIADLTEKIAVAEAEPIKVKQVMMADFDRSNFGNVKMRVDRCMSCHLGVGDPVLADTSIFSKIGRSEVFRTKEAADRMRKVFGPHPYPELLEAHSVERFGCTGCHGGQPMSVDDVEHAHGMEAHWEHPLLKGDYVQGSCRKCHGGMVNYAVDNAQMERVSAGRKLFIDFGCFGCHEAPFAPDWTQYKVGPSLLNVTSKVTPEWAVRWIMDPLAWNPHTRMPNFEFSQKQAEQVVAYLASVAKDNQFRPVSAAPPAGDPARGKQTFAEVGCVACHTVDEYEGRGGFEFKPAAGKNPLWKNVARDGNRVAEGNMFGPDLNKIGSKVSAAWLYDWVKNPKHYNPTSRMPNLRLSDQEAGDITAYLMSKKESGAPRVSLTSNLNDPATIEAGKSLIRDYGCFGCHAIEGMEEEGKVSVSLADFGAKTTGDLYFGYVSTPQLFGVRQHFDTTGFKLGSIFQHISIGEDWFVWTAMKMKNSRVFATDAITQKMPVFNMTDEEAHSLTVLLRSFQKAYLPATFTNQDGGAFQSAVDDGRFLTHWNNCVGCHKIEQHGGFVLPIIGKLVGKEGDDALPYGPPSLNTAGGKLQENWFYSFLRNPASSPVRDWLKIRMPTYEFDPSEISRLDKYFLGLEDRSLQFTDYSFFPASAQSLDAGRELFERLKCQQCHAVGSAPPNGGETAVPAPNLTLAGSRLQPGWIVDWVSDPGAIVPGTKMPNFFGTRQEPMSPFKDILNGDRQAQLNALRDYVWRLGGSKGFGPGVPGGSAAPADSAAPAPTTSVARSTPKNRSAANGRLSMR